MIQKKSEDILSALARILPKRSGTTTFLGMYVQNSEKPPEPPESHDSPFIGELKTLFDEFSASDVELIVTNVRKKVLDSTSTPWLDTRSTELQALIRSQTDIITQASEVIDLLKNFIELTVVKAYQKTESRISRATSEEKFKDVCSDAMTPGKWAEKAERELLAHFKLKEKFAREEKDTNGHDGEISKLRRVGTLEEFKIRANELVSHINDEQIQLTELLSEIISSSHSSPTKETNDDLLRRVQEITVDITHKIMETGEIAVAYRVIFEEISKVTSLEEMEQFLLTYYQEIDRFERMRKQYPFGPNQFHYQRDMTRMVEILMQDPSRFGPRIQDQGETSFYYLHYPEIFFDKLKELSSTRIV